MEQQQGTSSEDKAVVSTRTMEVAFSILLVAVGGLVIWDAIRLGHTWGPSGPMPGFFPFYIGCFIVFSGVVNGLRILGPAHKAWGEQPFVTRGQLKSVLLVFVPTLAYVLLMQYLGLYTATFLYILGFMMINGKYSLLRALPLSVIVPVLLFFMFEIWFLISLPKGPVEALFGY